jgi:hypothetical protein
MCFEFVLGTKNSSGHVQTNFFWKSSQLFVSALFPPPCRRTAWRRYSPFPPNDDTLEIRVSQTHVSASVGHFNWTWNAYQR